MKRKLKLYSRITMIMLLAFLLFIPATQTQAATRKEKIATFLNLFNSYSERVKQDAQNGKRWYYGRSKQNTFETVAATDRKTSCMWTVNWALKDMKILKPNEYVCTNNRGQFLYRRLKSNRTCISTRNAIRKNFVLINARNKTGRQLLKSGILKPGDICAYGKVTHMNVYVGRDAKGKLLWIDAGRIENGGGYFTSKARRTYIYNTFGPVALDNTPAPVYAPKTPLKVRYILRFR